MNNDNGTVNNGTMDSGKVCVWGGGTMGKNGMPLELYPLINTITC